MKEAKALEQMLKAHPVFGKEYKIINIVDDGNADDTAQTNEDDVQRVKNAITADPSAT